MRGQWPPGHGPPLCRGGSDLGAPRCRGSPEPFAAHHAIEAGRDLVVDPQLFGIRHRSEDRTGRRRRDRRQRSDLHRPVQQLASADAGVAQAGDRAEARHHPGPRDQAIGPVAGFGPGPGLLQVLACQQRRLAVRPPEGSPRARRELQVRQHAGVIRVGRGTPVALEGPVEGALGPRRDHGPIGPVAHEHVVDAAGMHSCPQRIARVDGRLRPSRLQGGVPDAAQTRPDPVLRLALLEIEVAERDQRLLGLVDPRTQLDDLYDSEPLRLRVQMRVDQADRTVRRVDPHVDEAPAGIVVQVLDPRRRPGQCELREVGGRDRMTRRDHHAAAARLLRVRPDVLEAGLAGLAHQALARRRHPGLLEGHHVRIETGQLFANSTHSPRDVSPQGRRHRPDVQRGDPELHGLHLMQFSCPDTRGRNWVPGSSQHPRSSASRCVSMMHAHRTEDGRKFPINGRNLSPAHRSLASAIGRARNGHEAGSRPAGNG